MCVFSCAALPGEVSSGTGTGTNEHCAGICGSASDGLSCLQHDRQQ